MKELIKKTIKLEQYDIEVNNYLTHEQIEFILQNCFKEESYENRQELIMYLVLLYCSNIDKDDLDKMDTTAIQQSGMWEDVKAAVYNYYLIEEGFKYYESPVRLIDRLDKMMPTINEAMKPENREKMKDANILN